MSETFWYSPAGPVSGRLAWKEGGGTEELGLGWLSSGRPDVTVEQSRGGDSRRKAGIIGMSLKL